MHWFATPKLHRLWIVLSSKRIPAFEKRWNSHRFRLTSPGRFRQIPRILPSIKSSCSKAWRVRSFASPLLSFFLQTNFIACSIQPKKPLLVTGFWQTPGFQSNAAHVWEMCGSPVYLSVAHRWLILFQWKLRDGELALALGCKKGRRNRPVHGLLQRWSRIVEEGGAEDLTEL